MQHKFKCLLFFLIAGFSSSTLAGQMQAAIVQVDNAINIEIAPYIWVSGTVIGRFDSKVATEVNGVLKSVRDVGERVEKNDVIAKINDLKYQLAVNEMSAEIKPIESMVEFHRKEAKRLEMLAEKNNAAKNQLDETMAKRDEALAEIKVVRAKLAMAQDELEKTTVRAPFSGVITERYKMMGEHVESGNQIIRLINTDKLEIQARVPGESIQFIKEGDTLTAKDSSSEINGTVRTVIPVGDDVSRLFEIRVEFDKKDWSVGTAVQIASPVSNKQKVIAVPRDALVIRQSGVVIYRINDESVSEIIPVKTGIANPTHIQVIGNVNEHDKIVIRGNERLRPGQKVQVMGSSE